MDTTQFLSIIGGIIAALVFIYLLTKSDGKKEIRRAPSIVKGFSCFFSNNEKEALEEMRAIALSDKGTPEIYLAIGFLYRKSGEYVKAAQVHEVLLGNKDLDKDYKKYLTTELAKDYLLADMPIKSLAILKEMHNREENPDNLEILAKANFDIQNYDNALAYLEKYEKSTSKTIRGFYAKCMIAKASASGDLSKTQKYIKNALAKCPECRSAHFIKAGLLMKEGKNAKAIEEYTHILSRGLPRDEKDVSDTEKAFLAAGEESRFIKLLKELAHDAKNPFIHIYLARHYMEDGEKDKAKGLLGEYLEHIGGNPALVKYFAEISEERSLLNVVGARKTFRCSECGADFDKYKDDCPVCSSFDSIYAK